MYRMSTEKEREILKALDLSLETDCREWDFESDQHSQYCYNAVPILDSEGYYVGKRVRIDSYDNVFEELKINENLLPKGSKFFKKMRRLGVSIERV